MTELPASDRETVATETPASSANSAKVEMFERDDIALLCHRRRQSPIRECATVACSIGKHRLRTSAQMLNEDLEGVSQSRQTLCKADVLRGALIRHNFALRQVVVNIHTGVIMFGRAQLCSHQASSLGMAWH